MARSIQEAINQALDGAVAQGRITAQDRGTVQQFTGYKGEVDGVDPQRYFVDSQLSEFLEIRQSDIVAEVGLAGDVSSLVLVLARPGAAIRHLRDLSRDTRPLNSTSAGGNPFLTGDITSGNLNRSRMQASAIANTQFFMVMIPYGASVLSICGGEPTC